MHRLHDLVRNHVSEKLTQHKVINDEDVIRTYEEAVQARDCAQDRLQCVIKDLQKVLFCFAFASILLEKSYLCNDAMKCLRILQIDEDAFTLETVIE